MVVVFCLVTAEVSPEFIENFPSQFDFYGMLKKICDDACVAVDYINDAYSLKGQWNMIVRAHSMLSSTLAVYGSSGNHGSRQFSALVEAAEAIGRGVELEEQVQHEMMNEKLKHIPNLASEYITQIPVDVNRLTELKDGGLNEAFVSRGSSTAISAASVLPLSSTQISEYNVHTLLKTNQLPLKNVEPNLSNSDTGDQSVSDIIAHTTESTSSIPVIQIYIESEGNDSGEEFEENSQNIDSTFKIVHISPKSNELKNQLYAQTSDTKQKIVNMNTETLSSEIVAENREFTSDSSKELEKGYSEDEPQREEETQKVESENTEIEAHACDECEFVGKSRNSLNDHKNRVHLAKPTKCDICQKVFPNNRYMKRHRACHSDPQYHCDECGKQYKVMKALKDHKKRHNNTYIKPEFKCSQCPKTFSSNYILECHVKSEHMGIKKKFLCQTCGKSFTTKHTLQQHANVHVGARPYKCTDCGKSFSYESALRDHKFIHEGTKKFTCEHPQCRKAFRQRSALKMHEKIHKEMKDFTCEECDRGFTQKQALQRHIRAHKGLKPFTCKLCNRSFGDAAIIRRHMILVHKVHKDTENWREDIVSNVQPNKDYYVKAKDTSVHEDPVDQMQSQANHSDNSSYRTVSTDESIQLPIRLPPVSAIHSFRHLESYTGHELTVSNSLSSSQAQQNPMTSQFTVPMPSHQDFMINQSEPVTQYNYTVTTLELPPTEVKTMEHTERDATKPANMVSNEVSHLDMEKTENLQYLESLESSMAYLRWKKNYELGRATNDITVNTSSIDTLSDQPKSCPSIDTNSEVSKEMQSAKTLDPEVHENLLYTYYNSNLAPVHYSINHFSGETMSQAESSADNQVQ